MVVRQVDNIFYKGNIEIIDSKVIYGKRFDNKPLMTELKIRTINKWKYTEKKK